MNTPHTFIACFIPFTTCLSLFALYSQEFRLIKSVLDRFVFFSQQSLLLVTHYNIFFQTFFLTTLLINRLIFICFRIGIAISIPDDFWTLFSRIGRRSSNLSLVFLGHLPIQKKIPNLSFILSSPNLQTRIHIKFLYYPKTRRIL